MFSIAWWRLGRPSGTSVLAGALGPGEIRPVAGLWASEVRDV